MRSMFFEEFEGEGDFLIQLGGVADLVFDVVCVAGPRGCSVGEVFGVEYDLVVVVVSIGNGVGGNMGEGVCLSV
jgi:hypothetical protein